MASFFDLNPLISPCLIMLARVHILVVPCSGQVFELACHPLVLLLKILDKALELFNQSAVHSFPEVDVTRNGLVHLVSIVGSIDIVG